MSYFICALVIPTSEESNCVEHRWPFVTLEAGLSLIPVDRDYILLTEGDDTAPADDVPCDLPAWLLEMASCFSKSAYIEAEFFGGDGTQASVVFGQGRILSAPVVSSGAINFALRQMGIDDESSTSGLLPIRTGKDPFDVVGLGRHRSVAGWLGESDF